MDAPSVRRQLPLALILAVVVRAPFWAEALRTPVDADTAIMGLMARHPFRATTMWGQPYGSPLEAWLAVPFVSALAFVRGKVSPPLASASRASSAKIDSSSCAAAP